jgi:hypothetical protein
VASLPRLGASPTAVSRPVANSRSLTVLFGTAHHDPIRTRPFRHTTAETEERVRHCVGHTRFLCPVLHGKDAAGGSLRGEVGVSLV